MIITKPMKPKMFLDIPEVVYAPIVLEPEDYRLAELLDEHELFTTDQLAAIFSKSVYACKKRLHLLWRADFIGVPLQTGDGTPRGWVPGYWSARYVAIHQGKRPLSQVRVGIRNIERVTESDYERTLEANRFFTRLIAHSRSNPDTSLTRWWSGRTMAEMTGASRSNGHGVWRNGEHDVGFFLYLESEYDPRNSLKRALEQQLRCQAQAQADLPLLIVSRDEARETRVRQILLEGAIEGNVATTFGEAAKEPWESIWKPINGRDRLRIADLPCSSGHSIPWELGLQASSDPRA